MTGGTKRPLTYLHRWSMRVTVTLPSIGGTHARTQVWAGFDDDGIAKLCWREICPPLNMHVHVGFPS